MPTFSRTATTDTDETTRVPVQPRRDNDATTQNITRTRTDESTTQTLVKPRTSTVTPPTEAERKPIAVGGPVGADRPAARPVTEPARPRRPRTSGLATLGLILSVAGIALVLSGPLAGYGIGVAGLGLLLSLAGLSATRKQHVAGKGDALIGIAVAIGAIVLGILALNGQLSWLGTDMHPASDLREWLDAQFTSRF
ncbi:hypothetical protein Acy02nite_58690 [Actinoplanes cyaneus]|uniref:Thrombospondin n=2 Tax=Actinoplanes cyaneus TaxID=52696 RepID=A0A919M842_9ACTN|nr:hypothetical protein Acy02nite_58690 [Actinoplanes cyaneus]